LTNVQTGNSCYDMMQQIVLHPVLETN